MTIVAPVSRATLEETVRWRLMSVCLVPVRMEEHVLTLLMGTTATAQLTLRYVVHALNYTAIFLIITMHCIHLFQGVNCDVDMNMCRSNPCLNGATCDNLPNGYSCVCAPGYTSFNCMNDTNECISNPCVHGTCAVSLHHAALSHACHVI